jgi:apolipoprotein N-acyltransferase
MNTASNDYEKPAHNEAIRGRVIIGVAMGVLSGVMLIFAFQPYSVWPLAFFAFVPMLTAAHRIVPRNWAGVPLAVGNFIWLLVCLIALFGFNLQLWFFPGIALIVGLMQLIVEPGLRLFHERTNYRWFVLQGAVNVVGFEMIRSFIPPINTHLFMVQTAYSQPWLIQPISVFSIYGMSLVIMLVNYALAGAAMALIDRKWQWFEPPVVDFKRSMRSLAWAGVILAAWIAIGQAILTSAPVNPPSVRVAAIQIGFLKPGHVDPTTQEARLQELDKQSRAAAAQGARLMVWPELGLGFDPQIEHTAELKALAAETDAYLFIGYGVSDDPRGWRNEMVLLTPEGEFLQVYGKNHGSSPGEGPIATAGVYPVYDTPFGQVATIICNDVNFTDTTRKLANNGAQLVAYPTWEVSMPGFHFELPVQGVLRGVENRVAIVKADTAFSAMISDPYGRILAQRDGSPDGEAFALVADVPLGTGKTLTARLGDWIGWLCLAGFIYFSILKGKVNRKKGG